MIIEQSVVDMKEVKDLILGKKRDKSTFHEKVGAGPITDAPLDYEDPNATTGSGFYTNANQKMSFHPERVDFNLIWHMGSLTTEFNDCLPLAINHLVGFEWFQCREQVVRA